MTPFLKVLDFMENRHSYTPQEQLAIIETCREVKPCPSKHQDHPEPL